jgi:hypothetical protein
MKFPNGKIPNVDAERRAAKCTLYMKLISPGGKVRYVQWGMLWTPSSMPNGWHLVEVNNGASKVVVHEVSIDKAALAAALVEQENIINHALERWMKKHDEHARYHLCARDIVNKLVTIWKSEAATGVRFWP